jgi:hypothetical protein
MAETSSIAAYPGIPQIQNAQEWQAAQLKNQQADLANQGTDLSNQYKTQQVREATATNDEAARQAQKSQDLRDAYSQAVTQTPLGGAPQPQPNQPAAIGSYSTDAQHRQQNSGQTPAPPPPAPTFDQLVAQHPSNNATLDAEQMKNGLHSGFQTFNEQTPNGPVRTTIDREKLLNIYGAKHPEDIEPLRAKFLADDMTQAKNNTDAQWQHHVGILSDMYGIKMLEDSPDLASKAYDQTYRKHQQMGEDMTGIPPVYPGKDIFDQMNDQMLTATDRASESAKAAAQAEKEAHDKQSEAIAKVRNGIAGERARIAAGELGLKEKQALPTGVGSLTGEAYRASLAPPQAEWLRGVATGDIPINPRSKEGIAAVQAANQAYPGIDISGAAKFKSDMGKVNAGTSGGVAVGTVKSHEHLDSMIQADQSATHMGGPGWIAQPVNAIGNLRTNEGNYEKVWEAGHSALVNEMSRSFKGGPPAESEIIRDMKGLKFSDSPARKNLVYKEYSDLLLGQSTGVEAQRQNLLRDADPGVSIMPQRTYDVIRKLNGGELPAGLMPPFDATPANTGVGSIMAYPKGTAPVNVGQNPRFPQAGWAEQNGKGGWFVNTGSYLKRVE